MTDGDHFPKNAELERVATGARWAEGPVWLEHERAVRFSDIPNNRILDYYIDTGELHVNQTNADYPNGRTLDLAGNVIECSHGQRAIIQDGFGERSTLVDRWMGYRLNSPNDVIVKSDGTIWFTDPTYGISRPTEGHLGTSEYNDAYVFRYDPANDSICPIVIDVVMPNGLAFSPDESVLYVADSSIDPPTPGGSPLPAHGHAIHAYDVVSGVKVKNGRPVINVSPGLPDGFRIDTTGDIWTSSFDSVQVVSPTGAVLNRVEIPEKGANVCFATDGKLYIAATTSLYAIKTNRQDAAHQYRQTPTNGTPR